MSPQGTCIAIVEVGHRPPQNLRQTPGNVEARPGRMDEVRRAFRAQYSFRTGRTGRVEADCNDFAQWHAGFLRRDGEAVRDLLQADLRPFPRARGIFAEPLDEKPLLRGYERVVDGV